MTLKLSDEHRKRQKCHPGVIFCTAHTFFENKFEQESAKSLLPCCNSNLVLLANKNANEEEASRN